MFSNICLRLTIQIMVYINHIKIRRLLRYGICMFFCVLALLYVLHINNKIHFTQNAFNNLHWNIARKANERDQNECLPVEYKNINDTVRKMIVVIQICDDQTKDPERPSADRIRSFERQLRQLNVLVKSISLFTMTSVHYAVLANTREVFEKVVDLFRPWPATYCKQMSLSYHMLTYPENLKYLKHLNRPCSTYRQLLYKQFPNVSKVINLDTDVIMMKPLEDLWAHFFDFNEDQIIGASAMLFAIDKRFRMFPKPHHENLDDGINSGVTLMHLDRWRQNMPDYIQQLNKWYDKYGKYFVFPAQDFFNVWLGLYKKHYYNLPCEWNVRRTLYQSFRLYKRTSICQNANNGAKALHGAGGHFTDGSVAFSHIFRIFERHNMKKDSMQVLKNDLFQTFDHLPPKGFNTSDEFRNFFLGELLISIEQKQSLLHEM